MPDIERNHYETIGMRTALWSSLCNVVLAVTKIIAGVFGNSYALIADGIESTLDIISSIIVWGGLKIALMPPDKNHPYGHGKAESLAGVIVSVILILVGLGIFYQSIVNLLDPDGFIPKNFTLYVLVAIILIKEIMFRYTYKIGVKIDSTSMKAEAWHHRSDAITSFCALIGVFIAIWFEYSQADDYATIVASLFILFNGAKILYTSLNEVMDMAPSEEIQEKITDLVMQHKQIKKVRGFRIRKSGLKYLLDIDIQVDPQISVKEGHDIAHNIENVLLDYKKLNIIDAIIHVEPYLPKEK